MNELFTTYYNSAVGTLKLTGSSDALCELAFLDEQVEPNARVPSYLQECVRQLDQYFSGQRTEFALNLSPQGTEFQQAVWKELRKIPYGRTTTYLDIARALNNQKAIRAVGAANGQNRIPIIIPCHRVIGRDGSLIGFGGGIWRKEFLLKHEKAVLL